VGGFASARLQAGHAKARHAVGGDGNLLPRFDGSPEGGYARPMRNAAAATLVFLGGFIIMVLEIIGARFLGEGLWQLVSCVG